jgi:hypothetical protein
MVLLLAYYPYYKLSCPTEAGAAKREKYSKDSRGQGIKVHGPRFKV